MNTKPAAEATTLSWIYKWGGLAVALYVLNFALTFHNVWPTLWITTQNELSFEIASILLILAIWMRRRQSVSTRVVSLLAAVLTVMTIGRYAEVTAPALYGRPVNIYWDAQYLPHVAEMLIEAAHPLLVLGLLAGIVLALGGLYSLLRLALMRVATACTRREEQGLVGGLTALLVVVYLSGIVGVPIKKLRIYSIPVSHMVFEQAGFIMGALGADEQFAELVKQDPLGDFALTKLRGADVIVHFIESYGATAFDSPGIAETLEPSRVELAAAIQATQRRVVSAFVVSPTFGGGSWLAHSSFMSALDIDNNGTYNLLLTRKQPTLSTRFTALGYRSLALMPGLRSEWPEGIFYRFAQIYGSKEIDYRGPEFGWWRIPDQYTLARFADLELNKTGRKPLFLMFTAISSHMPFRPTPPYQPDWSRALDDNPYDEAAIQASMALLPEWTNMQPSYAGTLVYTFQYLAGFLRQQADRDMFWIVIGDHQPAASVSGEGARWDAPVHIITANDAIIEELLKIGFVEGLTPSPRPISEMYELTPRLLNALR
jgi:hypothetical protein